MSINPCYKDSIIALRRIEGQIRGVQKMIAEERYCVDILSQLRSIVRAIVGAMKKIYKRHLENCVIDALKGDSEIEKQMKIDEVLALLSKHNGE